MKILIVDDEHVSRAKMQQIMSPLGECTVTECGKEALERFAQALDEGGPFDIVMLDISMPDLDGTEVLTRLRGMEQEDPSLEQGAFIMMVTALSDKATVLTCIRDGCNDYIAKPFTRETVFGKLDSHGLLPQDRRQPPSPAKDLVLDEIVQRFAHDEIDLPSPPAFSQRLRDMIAEGYGLPEIAELIKQDAAISSKLISLSNTAYYRGIEKNATVDQALARLGLKTVKRLVDTITNRSLYVTDNPRYRALIERLWEHSIACAYGAHIIAELAGVSLPGDNAYNMGLLHDIGKLILIQVLAELEKRALSGEGVDEDDLLETLATHHNRLGAALLKKWNFPKEFILVALYHDAPPEALSDSKAFQVVRLAHALVIGMGYACTPHNAEEPSDLAFGLELDPQVLPQIEDQVAQCLSEVREVFA